MKKILLSIMVIALVATAGIYTTRAYFNDTEVSAHNEIQAGTIDIAVDDQNPWTDSYLTQLPDLKPGEMTSITFVVRNVGSNPLVLRKSLGNFSFDTGLQSEPECEAEDGEWCSEEDTCSDMTAEDNDLSKVMLYSMTVQKNSDPAVVVIPESSNTTMADIESLWFPIAQLDHDDVLTVTQTYTLRPEAGNEYQGDSMSLDISLFAEQRMGPGINTTAGVILDNKTGSPDWYPMVDNTWAIVLRDGTTADLRAYGLTPGQTYHFQYSLTPYDIGTTMASGVADGDGMLTLTGTLPASPQTDMKLWLRDNAWSELGTLWEGNLIDY